MLSPALEYFFKAKWPGGYHCPRCDHTHAYVITTRKQPLYQCSKCRHQTSLTAGTVMEDSRTTLEKWYVALQRMAEPGGINAVQLMRAIGVTYKTAWSMLRKVREAISAVDREQPLTGTLRAEMTFYGQAGHMPRKRHPKERPCVVMAEFRYNQLEQPPERLKQVTGTCDRTSEAEEACKDKEFSESGKVVKDVKAENAAGYTGNAGYAGNAGNADVLEWAENHPVESDAATPYFGKTELELEQCRYIKLKVANPAYMHNRVMPQVLQPMFFSKHLDPSVQKGTRTVPLIPLHCWGETPLLKRIAEQAMSAVNRIYRGIGPKYLQRYLDEFCYRFNMAQQKQPILNGLVCLCMQGRGNARIQP